VRCNVGLLPVGISPVRKTRPCGQGRGIAAHASGDPGCIDGFTAAPFRARLAQLNEKRILCRLAEV